MELVIEKVVLVSIKFFIWVPFFYKTRTQLCESKLKVLPRIGELTNIDGFNVVIGRGYP
jgi:hypothetical protein